MAIKASNQLTMIDMTDGYSVILTSEAHTFMGGTSSVSVTQTTTTQAIVFQGGEQVPCTIGTMTTPTGISAVSDGKSQAPIITITATSALTSGGSFDIPIVIGDITIVKKFSYSIAFTGAKGDKGNTGAAGADAITLVITSSGGIIFKNTAIATTLTAHVYKGAAEVTGSALSALGTIKWYKDGGSTAVATGQTLTISAGDVSNRATYTAQLEG